MINYYFVCKRKLWFASQQINFEQDHENVLLGKLLDDNSYKREKKNILIDITINIDYIRKHKEIHETKKSPAIEESAIWQLKYYLYYLHEKGLTDITGVLEYPLLKKTVKVELNKNDFLEIDRIKEDIYSIINNEIPPKLIKLKICKKCAYYEMCYI